jgi:hypothetical protein
LLQLPVAISTVRNSVPWPVQPAVTRREACYNRSMSRIVRYEFTGSWLLFWFCCITLVGIPVAILYLLTATLRVETEMPEPERFIAEHRAGRWRGATG